jgi:hypothetical protein
MASKKTTIAAPPADTADLWEFKARFRKRAFGWQSQPAIAAIKQALAEIKKVAKVDLLLAADGAVQLIERLSPALEQVDSSSGAIGSAVNSTIRALAAVIGQAPAEAQVREAWLEQLYAAHTADRIPYIEHLTDCWGELCASKETASAWADKLLEQTRWGLRIDSQPGDHFRGTAACLSALFRAERFDELIALLRVNTLWQYQVWAVRAFLARGDKAGALEFAEGCRSPRRVNDSIDAICEEILLSSGMLDEAYSRYGVTSNQGGTYVSTFRTIVKKYPNKTPAFILADLVQSTPGNEGKWFAAAKEAGLLKDALALAKRSPCDPMTLARAARDYCDIDTHFAVETGVLAIAGLVAGLGFDITAAHVREAYAVTMAAAKLQGTADATRARLRATVITETGRTKFVSNALARELGIEVNTSIKQPPVAPRKRK